MNIHKMHGLSFYKYLGYHAKFFLDKYVSITLLHFAIFTCRNLVNLS